MKPTRHHEKGTALVSALLFALVVLGYVTTIISSGIAVKQQARYQSARQGAQHAAESGIHITLARLSTSSSTALLDAGELDGVLQGSGERAPRFHVEIVRAGSDLVDNDLDGLVDESDEADMVDLASTGTFDGVLRTVRVTLLARYRAPEFPSATYLSNPMADLDLDGNAFVISGVDVGLDGNTTGYLVPAVGVNGPTDFILSQVGIQQDDNITGAGGEPSVSTVSEIDLHDLVEEGARSANVVLEAGGAHKPAEEGDWGTIDTPAIVYAPGNVKISSGSAGAGLLIVNGDLEISGDFAWRGLVIVGGHVSFKGGGGSKRLTGALVVQNDLFSPDPNAGDNDGGLNINGTVDVLFSEQTLTRISQVFRTYSILNWREGPNPDYEALP